MKDMLSDAISKKLNATLESTGGIKALYGDPIEFNGEQIIPVGRVSLTLGAAAEGSGQGDAGASAKLNSLSKGGGGGDADASVQVEIEPLGFIVSTPDGPVFRKLE